jgi:4-hydroxy-tetrahydrodipicolinate reductase
MTGIIISGCNGTMGGVVSDCAAKRDDCKVLAGIDVRKAERPYPVYSELTGIDFHADVIIDFSHPSLLAPLLAYGEQTGTPLVLCTTGYDPDQVAALEKTSQKIPVFYSRNMSLGINLLLELAKKAAQVLGSDFDIEIIEKHHNQKIDAPSGTALMIADSISKEAAQEMNYVYDRHSQRKKRSKEEIGIHSIRGGTIVGEHEVIFAGPHEVITISHSAQSKEVFAQGAIKAAVFLARKPKGLYNMADLLI